MRVLGTSLLVLGLALTALTATAQTGQTAFTLLAKSQGGTFVWTDETGNNVNPTLTVPASAEVTITIKQAESDGVPHNIKVGTGATSDEVTDLDETVEHKFTAPATGTVSYICAIHPTTMKGTLRVAGSDGGDGGDGGENGTPGLGLLGSAVAVVGAALLLARRR